MKIFIDELPSNCFECPCFKNDIECCCGLDDGTNDYFLDEIDGGECPLLSLADHDKQVRKAVCEEIKAGFDTSGFNKIDASLYPPTEEAMWIGKGFNACKERLFNKLDQIQGEEYE